MGRYRAEKDFYEKDISWKEKEDLAWVKEKRQLRADICLHVAYVSVLR